MRPFVLLLLSAALTASPAAAQTSESPFETNLVRLSEILGSLHFLVNLCADPSDDWLEQMERLLEAENPDEARRTRFVASFNSGYQAFERTYIRCTPSAIEAIDRYRKEGAELTSDTAARYGN